MSEIEVGQVYQGKHYPVAIYSVRECGRRWIVRDGVDWEIMTSDQIRGLPPASADIAAQFGFNPDRLSELAAFSAQYGAYVYICYHQRLSQLIGQRRRFRRLLCDSTKAALPLLSDRRAPDKMRDELQQLWNEHQVLRQEWESLLELSDEYAVWAGRYGRINHNYIPQLPSPEILWQVDKEGGS